MKTFTKPMCNRFFIQAKINSALTKTCTEFLGVFGGHVFYCSILSPKGGVILFLNWFFRSMDGSSELPGVGSSILCSIVTWGNTFG